MSLLLFQIFSFACQNKSVELSFPLFECNNNIENLEWVTASENILHACENNPHQKRRQKRVAQIDKDTDEIICIHEGIKHSGRITGINSGSIVAVCKNRKLLAGGFKWKYDE